MFGWVIVSRQLHFHIYYFFVGFHTLVINFIIQIALTKLKRDGSIVKKLEDSVLHLSNSDILLKISQIRLALNVEYSQLNLCLWRSN
jgi:dolichyl-phosphate-mannose--protein O-mannosyl transferase